MANYVPSRDLIPRIEEGEIRAIGRLITRAEAGVAEARDALAEVYKKAGKAHVIGITGVPGSGKSTLVGQLAARLRSNGQKVAIVAIDPSSPFSGGSILGDRIRMSDLANDPNVYIRSMATRGELGGVARATLDATDVLDVGGYHTIIIETVGVGQDEVEIVRASHTTVVVSAPGLGDEIQAIKAGTLEIADIHLVSKCDRSDASRTLSDLKHMMTLNAHALAKSAWIPPVLGVSSYTGEGFDDFVAALERHKKISQTEYGDKRRLDIASFRLDKTAKRLLVDQFDETVKPLRVGYADRLRTRNADPYSLAKQLVASSIEMQKGISP